MPDPSFDLAEHLKHEHRISPFTTYLKEIVYGGTDGIITTFAVVAGFVGSQQQSIGNLPALTVLLFGFANLFADGVSMALGNFLSSRSEADVYRFEKSKELHEIRTNPRSEREESISILKREGFTEDQSKTLIDIYATNESYWTNFMMRFELDLPNPEGQNAFLMSFATFISFTIFGLMPLIPYLLLRQNPDVFFISIATTAGSLIFLGLLRYKLATTHWIRPILETLLLGGIAAFVAYWVGTLFRT
ncbi:MAG: VIT1/CCC1 transporter family protein [bacterium]|nr:VIT1/CCC1 transporter family protein [bacterium]